MAELRIEGIWKTFDGGVRAVADLGVDVADREFVFLLGPSGAGKTTTLRIVAGLEQPDAGRVLIGGRDLTDASPRERNVAMVYDRNSLYPHLSVFENLAYPLRLQKMGEAALQERIDGVARLLQIERLLQRRPRELSGGQQQRVAIGRALVRRANVFLMDEPISHLDAKLRACMRTELRHLQKTLGVTTLFVSHDQLEAMSMADRILVMNDGAIQQFGTPQEVFERPANRFVATFVGEPHMNLLAAGIGFDGGRPVARWRGGAIALERLPRGLHEGAAVDVGIRPEHVGLAALSEGEPALARVEAVEPLGAESLVTVDAGGQQVQARLPSVRVDRLNLAPGVAVSLRQPADCVYLFDRDTGQTLLQAGFTELRREAA